MDNDKKISSGAEKVEALAKQNDIEKENEQAKKRVQIALEKENKKQEKQAEKQRKRAEIAKKRVAEHDRLEAERQRKQSEKAIKKQEKEQQRIKERSARAQITKNEKIEKRRAMRAEKREKKRESKNNRDKNSIGGWITAVVSLSVLVLALGTIVTVGYFNMQNMQSALGGGYSRSVYELMEFVENLDTNLSKLKVSNGNYERQRFLTDVVIEAELCEECLETFPVDMEKTQNLTAFLNRVGDYSRSLLNKLARGGNITQSDEEVIVYMHQTVSAIRQNLNKTVNSLNTKEINKLLDGHSKVFDEGIDALENDTIKMPKSIYDGPFAQAQNSSSVKFIENMGEVSEQIAKEKLQNILEKYDIKEINCTGDAKIKNLEIYNFDITDEIGRKYGAQITKKGGILAMFDSFEDCPDKNFEDDACVEIAQNFLEKAGFSDMQEVWISQSETECIINFAYEDDDIVCYSDMIKVKVCYERGVVTGIEANSFIRSHEKRQMPKPQISLKSAKNKLKNNFEIQSYRLCLIPINNSETLAYEFSGEYDGNTYFVYIDATTGEECELFTVVGTNQGKALM